MANYIPGLDDYIPQVQPFKPNLDLYSKVLQAKQNKYDEGARKIGSLYGSLLNAPLTAKDNIERRNEFFKMVDNDIKKISGMDLSLAQNITTAERVFEPLLEDKYIIHDIGYTRSADNQIIRGENFKLCPDPEKCGGKYWPEGISYINQKKEDYANASPDQRLSMGAPKFNPYVNLIEKAFKWTKDQGLSAESVTSDGKYIVTRQNGEALKVPLQYIYTSLYGDDPTVKGVFDTKSYLMRKQFVNENLFNYDNDVTRAEDAWVEQVLSGTAKGLLKQQEEAQDIDSDIQLKNKYLKNKIAKNGVVKKLLEENPLYREYMANNDDLEISSKVNSHYKSINDKISSIKNMTDRNAMLNIIDNIVGSGLLSEEITKASTLFAATHNSITGIAADPYGVEAVRFEHDVYKIKLNNHLDTQKAMQLARFGLAADMIKEMGIMGLPGMNNPVVTPADPITSTGELTNPLEKVSGELGKATEGNETARSAYVKTVTDYLQNIARNGSPEDATYAKSKLQEIYGKEVYDISDNTFKKGGRKSNNFSDIDMNIKDLAKFFSNSKRIVLGNDTLFDNGSIQNKLFNYSQIEEHFNQSRLANKTILADNAGIIYRGVDLLDIDDKTAFRNLFKVFENGAVDIRNEDEYISTAIKVMDPKYSVESRKAQAKKDYDEQRTIFNNIWNSNGGGKLKGLTNPNGITNLTSGKTNTETAFNKYTYEIDASSPMSSGTTGLTSLSRNLKSIPNTEYKILSGTGHGKYDENKLYSEQETDKDAKFIFDLFVRDSTTLSSKSGSAKTPTGTISYTSIAANDPNVEVYTIYPDQEWLNSYANTAKGMKTLFGTTAADKYAREGISIYLNKIGTTGQPTSDNFLSKQFKMSPYEKVMNLGIPVTIERPHAGRVTIQNQNGEISISGSMYTYVPNGTGSFDIKTIDPQGTWGSNDVSAGMSYEALLRGMDELYIRNSTFLRTGVESADKIKSPEELLKQTGTIQPTLNDKIQEHVELRLRQVEELMKSY